MAHSMKFVLEFNYCQCKGCDETLKKVRAIKGVDSIEIGECKRKLTVFGPVKPETVIKMIKGRGKLAKLLREEEEEISPEINHQEIKIGLQQSPLQTSVNRRKVAPVVAGLISEPIDKPMEKTIHVCDPKHDHELELKTYNKPFKCDRCREDGFASGYRCKHCVYDLHEYCKDPKLQVTHVFFKESKFKFRKEPGKICDACGMEIHGHSYSCEDGNLDLHPACSKLPLCIGDTDFELSKEVEYKCFCCNSTEPRWLRETGVAGLCYVSKKNKISCHVHCISEVTQEAWKRGDLDRKDGDDNEGISKTLKNVDRKAVANVKPSGGKGGSLFLKVVTILLKTVIGILFGDPTGLIVSVFMGLGKEMLTL